MHGPLASSLGETGEATESVQSRSPRRYSTYVSTMRCCRHTTRLLFMRYDLFLPQPAVIAWTGDRRIRIRGNNESAMT